MSRPATVIRPELAEIKSHIKNLKKEAEMRLALDVEAQQSFESLSEQARAGGHKGTAKRALPSVRRPG